MPYYGFDSLDADGLKYADFELLVWAAGNYESLGGSPLVGVDDTHGC